MRELHYIRMNFKSFSPTTTVMLCFALGTLKGVKLKCSVGINNGTNNDNEILSPFSIKARNYGGTCCYVYDGMRENIFTHKCALCKSELIDSRTLADIIKAEAPEMRNASR